MSFLCLFGGSCFAILLFFVKMSYTLQQRLFLVKQYWITDSIKTTQRAYCREFGARNPPERNTILALVHKLETTGSLVSERGKHRSSRVPAVSADVLARMEHSPRKSLRRLSQETGYSYSMCRRAAKSVHLTPYKVRAVHELQEADTDKRTNYCRWFQAFIVQNPGILSITWFTDEAWFHLSGHVNTQNSRYWATVNPHVIQETPTHPVKVGVWCAVSSQRIVGPIFYDETVDTAVYRRIFMEFVEQLDDVELTQGYYQQDGATCHTSNDSMKLIESFFDDRIISKNLWPPRSPDLTPPDFFLWGYLKGRVYATRPQTVDDLKHNITQEINDIDPNVLQRVASNMERRVELCLMQNGEHFQHLL